VAVRRGNPVVFASSEALSACPRLRGRQSGPISAVCVPVSFMGRSLGVLHATGAPDVVPDSALVAKLTALGIQSGNRIGTVRAFERSQIQASTDGLTGMLNRRSLEYRLQKIEAAGKAFVFVMADLDHFKKLNDGLGHEAGDRALRVFADVVRRVLRTSDVAGRWGGEEFALVLIDITSTQAIDVLDRLRGELAQALMTANAPAFTCSFGVADSTMSTSPVQLQRIADDALYLAKEQGRDRAVIGDPNRVKEAVPRRTTERQASIDLAMLAREGG
jgi:diguanylate cyclase (GGDEF)-like protein